jgi:hypothetical protein
MSAYGLAFLSVLWARLNLPLEIPLVRNGHLILAVLISGMPMLLTLPWDVKTGILTKENKAVWPPYQPRPMNALGKLIDEDEIIATDAPWAVAWYADRVSLWLPIDEAQFETISNDMRDRQNPITGMFFTPLSTHGRLGMDILRGEYENWSRLIIEGSRRKWAAVEQPSLEEFPFPTPFSDEADLLLYRRDRN